MTSCSRASSRPPANCRDAMPGLPNRTTAENQEAQGLVRSVSRSDVGCRDHAAYTRLDLAATSFIEPYLVDTAPGTAAVGEPCFYANHCDGGPCLQTT
jgi:hypothetical protein